MKRMLIIGLVISSQFSHAVDVGKLVRFSKACENGKRIVVSAVGDILLHSKLQKKASSEKSFIGLWDNFLPYFQNADIAYANLEGPTAFGVNRAGEDVPDPGFNYDDVVYSSYPLFNYNPQLIRDLDASGFDVVSTANNHSLDRKQLGADRTIDALNDNMMAFTGTRKTTETSSDRPWYTTVSSEGVKTAWLACTYDTNGVPDIANQVLHCYKEAHHLEMIRLIGELKKTHDAVIVTPHWGKGI
jgi:hypothetical protein